MPWLWPTYAAYEAAIQPVVLKKQGRHRQVAQTTLFQQIDELHEYRATLQTAVEALGRLLAEERRQGAEYSKLPLEKSRCLRIVADQLVEAGEEILLRHQRLAESKSAYGFLHQHDILDHWERYNETPRLAHELDRLVADAKELLAGYHQIAEDDREFLNVRHDELPADAAEEFRASRNLFSVGQDQTALFLVGRGLEGVLREVAREKRLDFVVKGRTSPAFEADLADLIEILHRARWSVNQERLVTSETRALMHYLRVLRNSGAHARKNRKPYGNPREVAAITRTIATELWGECSMPRRRLVSRVIDKEWG